MFWPEMGSINSTKTFQPLEVVKVEDSSEMMFPPGLEMYHSSSPLRSMSPVRISLKSEDADSPMYVSQTSLTPKVGEGLLRSARSVGNSLSGLGSDQPAFVKPLRSIQSASGRLADFGDSHVFQKESFEGLGKYFEGDNSSTPSCLSPRGSVHSTDHGDDHCQADTFPLALDMRKRMADSLLDALRAPAT